MMNTFRRTVLASLAPFLLPACGSSSGPSGDVACEDADTDGVCDDADVCPGVDDTLGCDEPAVEICDDAVDNDGDGAVDCADASCAAEAACVPRYGSLLGTVVDVGGAPLARVLVRVGDGETVTDAGGHFLLPHLLIPDGPAIASFERAYYGRFARRIELRADDVVQTHVVMKATNVYGWSQDAAAGFTVESAGNVRLTVLPGALLDESGTPIDTLVDVQIVTGDPTTPADASIMPGDYFSDENGGTPLDSVAFLDIVVRTRTGFQVHAIDPAAPLVVEMAIPAALQADASAGEMIPWWSFDETTAAWRREGTAEVFDDGGTLWVRAEATHLSWWNCDRPVGEHACMCVDVLDSQGNPVAGAQLGARGVTYNGGSTPVLTDAAGRACITVKNSVASAEQVDLYVRAGEVELPYPASPVATPSVVASCLRHIGCPEDCEVLSQPIVLDRSGTVQGTVTLRSGAPAAGLLISNDHAASIEADAAGAYSLPAFLDVPLHVFTAGYTSPELLATAMSPVVTHDIALENVPPDLIELVVNGVPQALGPERGGSIVVSDPDAPVALEARALDIDGDAIAYAWSGYCYQSPAGQVPLECTPSDEASTVCDPPDGSGGPGTQEGCHVQLDLDDGYVAEPVTWSFWLYAGP